MILFRAHGQLPVLGVQFFLPRSRMDSGNRGEVFAGGNLYRLVAEIQEDIPMSFHFRTLDKYNINVDSWTIDQLELPEYEWPWILHRAATQEQLVRMMPLFDRASRGFCPEEFSNLGPVVEIIDCEFVRMLYELENVPEGYRLINAITQGEYVTFEYNNISSRERTERPLFVYSQRRQVSMWLPGLYLNCSSLPVSKGIIQSRPVGASPIVRISYSATLA